MALFEFEKRGGFPVLTGLHGLMAFGSAYWDAARTLVQSYDARSARPDFDVFPILYLYRQALELTMKGIVARHGYRIGLSDVQALQHGHRLSELPNLIVRLVPEFGVYEKGQPVVELDVESLRAVVIEWQKYDPDSSAFRYGVAKDGTPRINHDFTPDVTRLAETMDHLLQALFEAEQDMSGITYKEIERNEIGLDHAGQEDVE